MYIHRYAYGLSLQLGPLTVLLFYQENSFASMLNLFRLLIKSANCISVLLYLLLIKDGIGTNIDMHMDFLYSLAL
jgi:hypothetical protein